MNLSNPDEYKEYREYIAKRWYANHPEADQTKTLEQMTHDYWQYHRIGITDEKERNNRKRAAKTDK